MKSPRDVYYVEVSQLWHEILFCNFILQGIVSESALLSLCGEVLTERRILPVGEVGKIVSDIVASPFLSSQLKEKFGGLKKFLEKYPEIFVFSKDHPFNPHVVLKRFLSSEQLEMVEAGTSLQAIFKAANRQQQQLQQQQLQQGQNRHSSHGVPEAVQVGKKALQNRNNHLNNQNGNNRYDLNGSSIFSSAAAGNKNLASTSINAGEYSLTNASISMAQQQSPFNLDLSWKQSPSESRPSFNNGAITSWNDSFAAGNTNGHLFGGFGKGISDGLSVPSGGSGIPRLRGVDENFSSRFRPNGSDNGADRFLVGNNNRVFSGNSSDSFGSGGSNNLSMFSSNGVTSSSANGFEQQQQSFGFLVGNNNSIINSPQFSRSQQSQQQLGDSYFSYSQT
jgi:hypothetical protein